MQRISKLISTRFFRYLAVGIISLAGDYLIFITMYYVFKVPLSLSVVIGLATGILIDFTLNKYWAFKVKSQSQHFSLRRQILYYGMLLVVNSIFTYYFVIVLAHYGVEISIGKILATGCIAIWNYLVYKLAIFKQKEPTELI